ncbi:hypothetical protein P8917_01045 [Bacillus atrophaeus]|uniref:hypothetical protein n=1 Tax=Bacillus atrophaeus TaxID=1452 RepID=UPI0022802949|nr:hypothetical protein [Bacillus atrophaeus]MCY8813653.1 hypothetical protein [Bacillus atrophaeus]MCY8820274.1 hypothetical protein [Bacillus atrophaeus]MCY8828602.1 hypothetical protein [Bacillus atrophaeus]MCY8832689.1 hypothetical protein [Bacillus atrophaeus]MEC0749777.1 hypothetical protein [Bacillus atrophaeus]
MSKFIVLKAEDIRNYLNEEERVLLHGLILRSVVRKAAKGKPPNNYCVVNLDESYAPEVVGIMKKHGHWEGAE